MPFVQFSDSFDVGLNNDLVASCKVADASGSSTAQMRFGTTAPSMSLTLACNQDRTVFGVVPSVPTELYTLL